MAQPLLAQVSEKTAPGVEAETEGRKLRPSGRWDMGVCQILIPWEGEPSSQTPGPPQLLPSFSKLLLPGGPLQKPWQQGSGKGKECR